MFPEGKNNAQCFRIETNRFRGLLGGVVVLYRPSRQDADLRLPVVMVMTVMTAKWLLLYNFAIDLMVAAV